jgi:hypothetical protein
MQVANAKRAVTRIRSQLNGHVFPMLERWVHVATAENNNDIMCYCHLHMALVFANLSSAQLTRDVVATHLTSHVILNSRYTFTSAAVTADLSEEDQVGSIQSRFSLLFFFFRSLTFLTFPYLTTFTSAAVTANLNEGDQGGSSHHANRCCLSFTCLAFATEHSLSFIPFFYFYLTVAAYHLLACCQLFTCLAFATGH